MDNGITLEEVEFKMAYRIDVYSNLCTEDGCDDIDENISARESWERYVDLKLKYRYWIFQENYQDQASVDVPTHPCGDLTEEGFDEPDPF